MMENKVMVLAYAPFEGRKRNASYDLAVSVFGVDGVRRVEVDDASFLQALQEVKEFDGPVMWLGETDGRGDRLVLETVARNNLLGKAIDPQGPGVLRARYYSLFLNTPVTMSCNAGDHYCNRALYEMLRIRPPRLCVFLHVPREGNVDGSDLLQVHSTLKK